MAQAVARAIERAQPAARRGRHRHRQDLRLRGPGAALRRQGDRLHRDQDAAGPALPARPAADSRRAQGAAHGRAAQGARQLRLPLPPRARPAATTASPRAPMRAISPASSRSRAPRPAATRPSSPTFPTRRLWAQVTSTRENCLGGECPHYGECFVMGARKQALAADVVVINHHLFFADVVLKDEGLAELLPACNTVILDEAHQLPDTATLFFGEELAAGQLGELARDAEAESDRAWRATTSPCPMPRDGWRRRCASCAWRWATLPGKWSYAETMRRADLVAALDALAAALGRLAGGARATVRAQRPAGAMRAARARGRGAPGPLARSRDDPEWIRWLDVSSRGWQLHAAPLSIADIFARQVTDSARAWIFTSATLAVGGDFALLSARARPGRRPPPAAGTAPSITPSRRCSIFRATCRSRTASSTPMPWSTAALPVLQASRGRAFLLFTTLRALSRAREGIAAGSWRARASITRCWCRAKDRAASCWRAFACSATPCWSAARASGRASTCRARRCRWWSSTSCPSRRPTIRCSPRVSSTSRARAAMRSSTTSCRRPRSA